MGEARLSIQGAVAELRFSNPPSGLMDEGMETALRDAVREIEGNQEVRACVLAGADPGIFIRHYDVGVLSRRAEAMAARGLRFSPERPVPESPIHEALREIETGRVAYVAALNGMAMGGGFELALACDLRVAEPGDHRYGLPEINLGILPGAGGTQRLAALAGEAKALEMTLLGEVLSAEALAACGLARLAPAGGALAAGRALAARLAAKPPQARAHIKRLVRGAAGAGAEGFAAERTLFCDLMTTPQARALMAEVAEGGRTITDPPEGAGGGAAG